MQKLTRKIAAALSAFIFAAVMMFSPVSSSGFFRHGIGSPAMSATLIRAEEQPITDESKGVAALLTLLFANGIRFVGEWENVSEGASKLWNDFTTATGNTVTLAALGAGVAVTHGYMRTSAAVNNAVSAFQSWYEGAFSVPSSGAVSIPVAAGSEAYARLDANVCYRSVTNGTVGTRVMVNSNNVRGVVFQYSTSYYTFIVSDSSFMCSIFAGSGNNCGTVNTNSLTQNVGGVVYYYRNGTSTKLTGNLSFAFPVIAVASSSEANITNAVYYTYGAGAGLPDITIEGQSYDLKDGYNLNIDQSLLLDIANLAALVASIGLTLDSINDLVQDWPAIFDTPWADTDVPDITFPVPIEDTPDNTIPWVNVPDAVSPDPVPDYVPDTPAGEGEYRVLGLDKVFPFSIPFDLYYLATILVAEPETPTFTYALYDPTSSSLVTQEVNLHQFDTIAALLRTLETVLFIATLIFVTRGLIRS